MAASGIDDAVWERLPSNTNVSESAHNASNATGIRLTLSHAVAEAAKKDRRSDVLALNFAMGQRATQRSKGPSHNIGNAMYQQQRRLLCRSKSRADNSMGSGLPSPPASQSTGSLDPDVIYSSPRGMSSSGVAIGTATKFEVRKRGARGGRAKGSKNIGKSRAGSELELPRSEHDIYKDMLISSADQTILESLPEHLLTMFYEQHRLLLREETMMALSKDLADQIRTNRERYSNRSASEIEAIFRDGGMRLDMFCDIWDMSLKARQSFLDKANCSL
ncbi:protein of unknown function [Taphrina deformans PYCC 5710]|uniref:Uncharacterized protein n=1 Tax=Taphrina deformans (strain PYCC 5710 / ATCC 11124 / CBS 356.35 / IMI 108563 / JCM 9778 / NBRC 8474) TaxID=1097556 RepID=R4XCP7_TAPDE|nr:protein of unknown function [Taphrina deformans PYCC 5710]|eukprot:CCG83635.1 protein of unknown function [Taphrina deformans PYCC 5710]